MSEAKLSRSRKCQSANVLSDTNGFEAAKKLILDLERLRRLADVARPLRERTAKADSSAMGTQVGDRPPDPSDAGDTNRQPARTPRGARDDR
jgi:hypothetical protein